MKVKLRNCNECSQQYEKGFFGSGFKYCSRRCQEEARRKRYVNSYVRAKRDCIICHRDINSVGLKKHSSKYCSNRCMFIAQHKRAGQKTILLKIPISEIPQLFGEKK